MGKISKFMIVLLALLALGYYWLLVNAGPANAPARTIDIAAIRRAADALPGEKPTAVTFAPMALRHIPGAALAAGTGLRQVTSGVITWRLETAGGGIVIDPGLSEADAHSMGFKFYDRRARALVDRWMDQANMILFTHAHVDHVGGFLDHPRFESIVGKAVVSEGMVGNINGLWRENARLLDQPRKLGPIEAVAPGVVLIQAPGHTPASEMIYVRLASGREYLFAGDTVSLSVNAEIPTPRSRLVADWLAPEDRPAVIGWLKGLKALKEKNPDLVIVPSHDADWLAANGDANGIAMAKELRQLAETK
ncbi:MBL fold metallo-hydrolase [Novosphingobium jiangmenense]|uniref:MBL fold metallo-hydrolase n=1 Tax=Novosphingobium jiangmenense TaxID=2791981 RepID=A0ABS0HGL4_9SPHN|nr:MBL fold metallo-hydrolase [Novosphingobium jiangmenense]MBF9151402.1 MBL fold metallo-hydrolase [Novosphingobium jiangmenense]